jgi:excinuclease ABC subunit C
MDVPPLIARKLAALPDRPGVYLWKNGAGEVLYVGKAKNLRARVPAYFALDHQDTPERAALAAQIADLDTIIVPSEAQALLPRTTSSNSTSAVQYPAARRQELRASR